MWALRRPLRPPSRSTTLSILPFASPLPSSSRAPQTLAARHEGTRTFVSSSSARRGGLRELGSARNGQLDETSHKLRRGGPPSALSRGRSSFSTTSRNLAASKSFPPSTPLNEAQVPLISPHLRAQLFPSPSSPFSPAPPSPEAVKLSLDHLRHHQLVPDSSTSPAKKLPTAIDFDLPRLQGPTITHHFHALGRDVAEPYLSLAKSFATADLPLMPSKDRWVLSPGWTFYSPDGSSEPVEYPPVEDEAMVFDVETMPYQGGAWPVMAVAVGKTGWYGWCSPWLTGDDDQPNHLVNYGPSPSSSSYEPSSAGFRSTSHLFERVEDKPRLIVGHNVLYDRARIAQEYDLRRPSTRYLDTLSLHVAVSGLTNPQRPTWLKYRKEKAAAEEAAELEGDEPVPEPEEEEHEADEPAILAKAKERKKGKKVAKVKDWKEVASVNSLAEVARLHCGIKVDKSLRNVFIDPTIEITDVREHFVDLVDYCARDVDTTVKVYQAVFPKFLESCPHPATFAGVTLMSQPVLPVDRKWPEYIERAEQVYQTRLAGVVSALNGLAVDARKQFDRREKDGTFVWEKDYWLRQLDWSPKRARRLPGDLPEKQRTKKQIEQAAKELAEREEQQRVVGEAVEQSSGREELVPAWMNSLSRLSLQSPLLPILLETTYRGFPVVYTHSHGWLFAVPSSSAPKPRSKKKQTPYLPEDGESLVLPSDLTDPKDAAVASLTSVDLYTICLRRGSRAVTLVSSSYAKKVRNGVLSSPYEEFAEAIAVSKADEESKQYQSVLSRVRELAEAAQKASPAKRGKSVFLCQLDWTPVPGVAPRSAARWASDSPSIPPSPSLPYTAADLVWPKWYWDLDVPGHGLDVSIGKRAAPLLLKLKWKGFPVAYSKEHGWLYRIPYEGGEFDEAVAADPALKPLEFEDPADASLDEDDGGAYVKLPHPDGEGKNVGSPLSKPFVKSFEEGVLTSEYPAAEAALALNASCSYWTSARERISNQMVVWEGEAKTVVPTPAAVESGEAKEDTRGLILPQVLPMGTITRRSVERTWLTASNAKKNRVGSELKSMIRAPPGYAIVGADVDSEELWICSVMGDAQFGIHGATAIGWMTLEGTKSAGTDMHSKTASILGISRDDAKVFNYSRIYGAGVKHAVVLLLKANPRLSTEEATTMAQKLYASTKGLVDRSAAFGRNFWHGGTESFVFNKLEGIAKSERPRTPALGCGLTAALTKANLPADGKSKAGEGYLPSRINWVVQSSGVDYLHLLLVSMEYLTKRFEIDARYLISVHDEVRYLVKEEDKYRAALALQIANVWTRSLFAYRLQMPDLPQGCAFFSAVDVDTCFRKEVNMPCTTPSNPDPIPFGESLDITDTLSQTHGGSLFADSRPMVQHELDLPLLPIPSDLSDLVLNGEQHRVDDTSFLLAQTSSSPAEIAKLWRESKEADRRTALGLPPKSSSSSPFPSRRRSRSSTSSSSASSAETAAPRKRKALRFDDDPALLPLAPSSSTRSRKVSSTKPVSRTSVNLSERKEEDDDEDDWDEPDQDDYLEKLVPAEAMRKFGIHSPISRTAV